MFTVGKRATTHNLLATPQARRAPHYTRACPRLTLYPRQQELATLGASVHHTERGGDITYHGPGQLVLYPVVALRQLGCGARAYVEGLEDVLARVAALHGVQAAGRLPGAPGVWVAQRRKIAAVGVRISGGVTSHGAALNVCTDLSAFRHIVPCGIADKVRVASLY